MRFILPIISRELHTSDLFTELLPTDIRHVRKDAKSQYFILSFLLMFICDLHFFFLQ